MLSRTTGLASGNAYPILRRLLEAGSVEARWATRRRGDRPETASVRLTAEGRAVAVARAASVSPWGMSSTGAGPAASVTGAGGP